MTVNLSPLSTLISHTCQPKFVIYRSRETVKDSSINNQLSFIQTTRSALKLWIPLPLRQFHEMNFFCATEIWRPRDRHQKDHGSESKFQISNKIWYCTVEYWIEIWKLHITGHNGILLLKERLCFEVVAAESTTTGPNPHTVINSRSPTGVFAASISHMHRSWLKYVNGESSRWLVWIHG